MYKIREKGKMQDKKIVMVSTIVALLMLSMAFAPALAFVYPSGQQDNLFEINGPHIDQILIKKYAETGPEFQALQAGEIDITDWALDATWTATFNADPTVRVISYGGEAGYYTMNFNHNNNTYLGNPENPLYANPINPNPTAVISMRQAFGYFVDRVALCAGPGEGLYVPIFTPIPSYMAFWIHPDIRYNGALDALTYNPNTAVPDPITVAAGILTADGFKMGGAGGKRYWDKDGDNVYDGASEDFNIIIYSRADKLRKGAANFLCAGLDNAAIQVPYTRYEVTGGQAWQKVMVEKDYNIYTSGWIFIGPDPDYLFDLYNWDNYYHPEDPPNFGAIGKHDALLQEYSAGLKYATSVEEALDYALLFQEQFAATACEIPLGSTAGSKAYKKYYTGGTNGVPIGDAEDVFRKKMWTHVVNEKGIGENSWWTTLDAYPTLDTYPVDTQDDVGHYYDNGAMTMRYGWKDNTMPATLNPMYSSWYWESEIYGRVYDSLGARDPMTKGPVQVPQLAYNWTVGSWVDPADQITKAKIVIQIDGEILWSDGVELTIEDVIYTFIQMPVELREKGCPDVWWQPTVDQIAGFYRLDWCTVEILMKTGAVWSMNQVVGNIIVPKHLWKPYIATHTVAEISGDFSNRDLYMLTGTGPFLYIENTPSTALLRRNPLYYHTLQNMGLAWQHTYGYPFSYANGVTATAVAPSTQISPQKIKEIGGFGLVNIVVPVTNTNLKLSNLEHIVITIKTEDDVVYATLVDEIYNFAPGETKFYLSQMLLPKGFYDIDTQIEIVGGLVYDYVHAYKDPSLWWMFLGPTNVGPEPRIANSFDLYVSVKGDVNEDGYVNIFDIVKIALAYDTVIGGVGYNPVADVNRDGYVNIFDIVIAALDFGWSCPVFPT